MNHIARRFLFAAALLAALSQFTLAADGVPAPRDVLGFEPGEDRKLAGWSQIVDYFRRLDQASDRIVVHELGRSTRNRPFIVAIISSEENIRDLDRIKASQRKLADPRLIADAGERERLIRETPAVVAITCSIHSTEVVAAQMSMTLAHRLASDNGEATRAILKNTVLLLIPSVNPDGIDIVGDWYGKTLGTKHEGTSPPELYHHYVGHDNNRDWFMLTQVETQMVTRLFWKEWFPEIVYDVHQQGQFGSRMCVPPFFDPHNPNIDPVILRQVGAIGMRMALNLTAAGFKGVVTNSTYDMWWHGGLRSAPYYHNAIGILTEAASARLASPLEVKRERLRAQARGLPNPLVTATNFPEAWEGGWWRPRDILEMELITCRTVLEEASIYRESMLRNFVNVAERAIEAGKTQAPYAYVVPSDQRDVPTTRRMMSILMDQGIEVHRAGAGFSFDGRNYPAGSFIVPLAQPYRANVKALFEVQRYPDRRLYPDGPAEPPYDVAGWTLPMQMGVEYAEASKPFDSEMELIDGRVDHSIGASAITPERGRRFTILVEPGANNAYAFINDLLDVPEEAATTERPLASISIYRLAKATVRNGRDWPAGTFLVEYAAPSGSRAGPRAGGDLKGVALPSASEIALLAARHGIRLEQVSISNPESIARRIKRPRVALYRGWTSSMDEGWTRWVLEQFSFDFISVGDAEIRAGGLDKKLDVIILPDQSIQQIVSGNRPGSYPEEYTGGIGDEGVKNLRAFVEAGGVLVCLNSSSELALARFELPVRNVLDGVSRSEFYAPGSIFRARMDTSHPVGFGMAVEADIYFTSGMRRPPTPEDSQPEDREENRRERRQQSLMINAFAFEIDDSSRARSVAHYPEGNPLRSGWLLGPERIAGRSALVEADLGKGKVVMFGFRPQHRGQTWGTFKLLFNAILMGGVD